MITLILDGMCVKFWQNNFAQCYHKSTCQKIIKTKVNMYLPCIYVFFCLLAFANHNFANSVLHKYWYFMPMCTSTISTSARQTLKIKKKYMNLFFWLPYFFFTSSFSLKTKSKTSLIQSSMQKYKIWYYWSSCIPCGFF